MTPTASLVLALLALLAIAAFLWRRSMSREVAALRQRHESLAEREREVDQDQALIHDLTGPRPAKVEARRQATEAHRLAGLVEHELRMAERALSLGRLGKAHEASRRVARNEALLGQALDAAGVALRALRDDRRGVARTLGEATSLLAYLRGRVARLPEGVGREPSATLDAIERDLAEARALLAAGEPAHALARARAIRLALVGCRRALMRRTAVRTWLAAVPTELARLEAEAARLRRAGFVHLPAVAREALAERASGLARALDAGDARALERGEALRAELQRIGEQLGRFEALHERNGEAIARLQAELADLAGRASALVPPELAGHLVRAERRSLQHARDRVEARIRALEMALRTAAADNHKDVQRFTEANLRLATLEREASDVERELAKAEARRRHLAIEEQRARDRLAGLAAEVERLDTTARRLGMRPDPGVAALLAAAIEGLASEPLSLDDATRAVEGLANAVEAYGERVRCLDDRLQPRPGHVTLFRPRQEARLPGRDPEH